MSKLIVEMEMPRDCWCCPNGHTDWIYNDDGAAQMVCFCNICNTEEDNRWISETETERPSWCPIKGVLPDEHGDLIDRDKAKDAFDSSFLTFRMKDGETMRGFYQRTIAELPTVIAAERKDDGTTAD